MELLVDEHKHIKRMLVVMRKFCARILNGEPVEYDDFYKIIDFVRNYADKHHHGKEEQLLFTSMTENLGPLAEKLIRHGMNVEHDLGRLHVMDLEEAVKRVQAGDTEAKLDLIANAISYTHLLNRHIEKEDNAVYVFAQKNLPGEVLAGLEAEFAGFELKAELEGTQQKYLAILSELENKA